MCPPILLYLWNEIVDFNNGNMFKGGVKTVKYLMIFLLLAGFYSALVLTDYNS